MSDSDASFRSGPDDAPLGFEPCVDGFVEAVIRRLKDGRGVHAETAVTAAAATAGAELLRTTGLDLSGLEPGSSVFGTGVDESGPEMLGFLASRCAEEGIDPATGWGGAVSDDHRSLVPAIDLVRDLRPELDGLVARHGIPADGRAKVAAAAAVRFLRLASAALDPEIGKAVAANALVAASKTVPHPR